MGLRDLFEQLDVVFDPNPPHSSAPSAYGSRSSSPGSSTHGHSTYSLSLGYGPLDPATAMARDQLFYYRECLRPFMSMEQQLTESISGVVSTVGGIYVRSDWQAAYPRERDAYGKPIASSPSLTRLDHRRDVDFLDSIQRSLGSCRELIRDLWRHPYLPPLIKARRVKVEDFTAL